MSPRAVNTLVQLTLPGAAFRNSSEGKCWIAVSNTSRARKAAILENLNDPEETYARSIVTKFHVGRGRASAS